MIAIVMGVSGCGKTTVGKALAADLGWTFLDADDFHPAANIQKMSNGVPLTDEDRWPWLDALRDRLHDLNDANQSVVLACSALKQTYRVRLASAADDIRWIYLQGTPEQIRGMMERRKGHFMNPGLLASQFAALEEPADALVVPAVMDVAAQVRIIRDRLARTDGEESSNIRTEESEHLRALTVLSHEFGTSEYVKGGGGNTSVKLGDTLWIKPSGTTLAGLQPDQFVAVDRRRLAALYAMEVPPDETEREARVKDLMMASVIGGSRGRPSVETPLHDVLNAVFVVHTHATLVNGLTCAREGDAVAARLFPDALWVPYTDPGFTLSMEVRSRVADHAAHRGRQPAVILLENHGLFVSGDTPDEVRNLYRHVMNVLRDEYAKAGISLDLKYRSEALDDELREIAGVLASLLGADASAASSCAPFEVAEGPLTPDHMVYAKAWPYTGPLNSRHLDHFRARRGYPPRVIVTPAGVFGIGRTPPAARLALELAQDGGLVRQLAMAFGGVQYMSEAACRFIESWEVESYREQQLANPPQGG